MNASIERFARTALLIGAVSLAPIPASAQSAEETLAVMLWGLQEGARGKGASENVWEVEDEDGARSSFRIRRLTDCQFGVSSQVHRADRSDVLEFDYVLNFAAVHDYSAWLANGRDGRIIVKIEGQGWYSKTVRSNATGRVVYRIDAGNVDAYVAGGGSVKRLQCAFAYFRSTFCRPDQPSIRNNHTPPPL